MLVKLKGKSRQKSVTVITATLWFKCFATGPQHAKTRRFLVHVISGRKTRGKDPLVQNAREMARERGNNRDNVP